jgi:hypothetical protein
MLTDEPGRRDRFDATRRCAAVACRTSPVIVSVMGSVVGWRFVRGAERQRRRYRLPELLELALDLVEPAAELTDQRVELANQAVLVGELHIEIEPALGIGIVDVGHGATIARLAQRWRPTEKYVAPGWAKYRPDTEAAGYIAYDSVSDTPWCAALSSSSNSVALGGWSGHAG